jgi:hypothetical protein
MITAAATIQVRYLRPRGRVLARCSSFIPAKSFILLAHPKKANQVLDSSPAAAGPIFGLICASVIDERDFAKSLRATVLRSSSRLLLQIAEHPLPIANVNNPLTDEPPLCTRHAAFKDVATAAGTGRPILDLPIGAIFTHPEMLDIVRYRLVAGLHVRVKAAGRGSKSPPRSKHDPVPCYVEAIDVPVTTKT